MPGMILVIFPEPEGSHSTYPAFEMMRYQNICLESFLDMGQEATCVPNTASHVPTSEVFCEETQICGANRAKIMWKDAPRSCGSVGPAGPGPSKFVNLPMTIPKGPRTQIIGF